LCRYSEVDRVVSDDQLASLNGPVNLEGVMLLPMRVTRLTPRLLQIVLREGKNRQIR